MAYLPNIPAATDLLSASQPQIQANFQALGAMLIPDSSTVIFNQQALDPTTSVNQVGMYSKLVGGAAQLFIRPNSDGTPVNFTSRSVIAVDAAPSARIGNGYTRLPSGIMIQWGIAFINNTTTFNFVDLTGSAFTTACWAVQIAFIAGYNSVAPFPVIGGDTNVIVGVTAGSVSATQFRAQARSPGGGVQNCGIYFFAIGI